MSCYVSFFIGDATEQADDKQYDFEKMPELFSVNQRNEFGEALDLFKFDEPTLVTPANIDKMRSNINDLRESFKKQIAKCEEIRGAILRDINAENARSNLCEIDSELDEMKEGDEYCIKILGYLDVLENVIVYSKQPVTALVG